MAGRAKIVFSLAVIKACFSLARPDFAQKELHKNRFTGYPWRMKKIKSNTGISGGQDFTEDQGGLGGQLLIAMPGMKDPRFARSVILMCAHSRDGAMGIVLNQPSEEIGFADLLGQFETSDMERPARLDGDLAKKPVYVGGPVENSRGFVLHSSDYYVKDSTLPLKRGVNLTATLDILHAIARHQGPERFFVALGYAGWAPGQLEHEIMSNGWLHCAVDPDIIFEGEAEGKHERALALLGIDPGFLVSEAGHS